MASSDRPQAFTPSLLDRLIDPASGGTSWRRGYGVEQVIDAIRRDLEDLLNTHATPLDAPEAFPEVRNSIVTYGIPDPSAFSGVGDSLSQQVGRAIEGAVSRFEPRLREVRAIPLPLDDPNRESRVRFQITAKLRLEPAPDVTFVTVMELSTGRTTVERNA